MNWNWDVANFFVQAAAAVLAATAIFIAAGAQRSIARERRRQFELDILSQVLTAVEETDLLDDVEFQPGKLRKYQHRMQLIDDPPSYWTSVMTADWYEDLFPDVIRRQRELTAEHAELVDLRHADPGNTELRARDLAVQDELHAVTREAREGLRRRLVNDLEKAIKHRTESVDRWWGWRQ